MILNFPAKLQKKAGQNSREKKLLKSININQLHLLHRHKHSNHDMAWGSVVETWQKSMIQPGWIPYMTPLWPSTNLKFLIRLKKYENVMLSNCTICYASNKQNLHGCKALRNSKHLFYSLYILQNFQSWNLSRRWGMLTNWMWQSCSIAPPGVWWHWESLAATAAQSH